MNVSARSRPCENSIRSSRNGVAQRTREAEEANHAKSAFLAKMSHEIRNPMNVIMGLSQLSLQDELRGRPRDYVRRIHSAAQSLLGLINDILDFSKIEAGRLDMERIDFDLGEVLDDVAGMIGIKASEKGLEFLIDTAPDLPATLQGDPLRLGQVLINLCNNAVKFTERGEITVRVTQRESEDGDLALRFEVIDSVIGMTEEQRGRLFQAFSQADSATSRKFGGTGLGLTISKRLVEMMHGEIGVDSTPGQSSTFHFTARCGHAHKRPEARLSGGDELRDVPVLVVDDNSTSREIISRHLTAFGLQGNEAPRGRRPSRPCLPSVSHPTGWSTWTGRCRACPVSRPAAGYGRTPG